jgi:hypothetical protein
MSWNTVAAPLQPPTGYEQFTPEHWEAKAEEYQQKARGADRPVAIRHALTQRDRCLLAAIQLRTPRSKGKLSPWKPR